MPKSEFDAPNLRGVNPEEAAMPYRPSSSGDMSVSQLIGSEAASKLRQLDGVEGIGVGQDAIGNPSVVVYVRDAGAASRISSQIDGVPTVVEVVGEVRPLPG